MKSVKSVKRVIKKLFQQSLRKILCKSLFKKSLQGMLFLILLFIYPASYANDLLSFYKLAKENDPTIYHVYLTIYPVCISRLPDGLPKGTADLPVYSTV